MDKRLKKLLQPGHQFYFIIFLLFVLACAYISIPLAVVGALLDGFLFLLYQYRERTRSEEHTSELQSH